MAYITYSIDKTIHGKASIWVEQLLDQAYGQSKRRKRLKVLINPFGGKGSAQKYWGRDIEPIFRAAQCELDVERTQHNGHAREIAEQLDVDAFDVVACCSGDGVPHEVFNGLARKKDASRALQKVAVVQLPCGSGNALSFNLNGTDSPSMAAVCIAKGLRTPLDLVSVTQGDTRTLSFLSQAFGIVAETDLGTENIRWMGEARFTFGFLKRLIGQTIYPCDIAVKTVIETKQAIRDEYRRSMDEYPQGETAETVTGGLPPLRYGTIQDPLPAGWEMEPHLTIGNFYAGNMSWMTSDLNFFPAALPADGCIDLVRIPGILGRPAGFKFLVDIGRGTFFDSPHVKYEKVEAYRLLPHSRNAKPGQNPGYISIDGESVPFEPFQVEVHRGLGMVLTKTGKRYEAPALV